MLKTDMLQLTTEKHTVSIIKNEAHIREGKFSSMVVINDTNIIKLSAYTIPWSWKFANHTAQIKWGVEVIIVKWLRVHAMNWSM